MTGDYRIVVQVEGNEAKESGSKTSPKHTPPEQKPKNPKTTEKSEEVSLSQGMSMMKNPIGSLAKGTAVGGAVLVGLAVVKAVVTYGVDLQAEVTGDYSAQMGLNNVISTVARFANPLAPFLAINDAIAESKRNQTIAYNRSLYGETETKGV